MHHSCHLTIYLDTVLRNIQQTVHDVLAGHDHPVHMCNAAESNSKYRRHTLEIGETSRDSTLMRGLYTFCLAKPGSMTYTMPSMVNDVSAMLVDTTILRPAMPFLPAAGACTGISRDQHLTNTRHTCRDYSACSCRGNFVEIMYGSKA